MGDNWLANPKPIEYPDFTGERAKYETLQSLAQERKLRAQAAVMQQAEFDRKKKDWEREDNWRNAFSNLPMVDPDTGLPPAQTVSELYRRDPMRTHTWYNALLDSINKARDNRVKAQTEREKNQALGFHDLTSGMGIEDPQKRLEYAMNSIDRWKAVGLVNQDELEDLAQNVNTADDHAKWIDRVGSRVLGPEKWGQIKKTQFDLEAAQRRDKEAIEKHDWDVTQQPFTEAKNRGEAERAENEKASRDLGFVRDQPGMHTWYSNLPQRLQTAIGPEPPYSEANVALLDKGFQTAQQRETARQQAIPDSVFKAAYAQTDPSLSPAERSAQAFKIAERHTLATRPVTNVTVAGMPSVGAIAAQKVTGEEFLKTLPLSMQNEIRGMAEGRITAPKATSRAPGAQQKIAALMLYDPEFSEQRAQIRREFMVGKSGTNLGAISTAMVHLARLYDASLALNNGTFKPGNQIYQQVKDLFGARSVTDFRFLKDAVIGEMATALKGTATDKEIEHLQGSIQEQNSPDQMIGVAEKGVHVLADKANTYAERYHAANPADKVWSPILPSAQAAMQRFGVSLGSHGGTEGGAQGDPEGLRGFLKGK